MPWRKSGPSGSGPDVSADQELEAGYAALDAGDAAAARAWFEAVWRAEPGNLRAAEALAEALTALGLAGEAVGVLAEALALRPESRPLRRMLAGLLPKIGRGGEAESHWRELLLLDARDDGAMVDLASLLVGRGALPEGIDLLQRALRVRPENAAALFALGTAWAELGETAKAAEAFGRYLALDPDDELGAAVALDRLDPQQLTPSYIRTLFDQYADRFDSELVLTLEYRVPALLREAVLDNEIAAGDVLDLGCGTGLAGAALRDLAAALHGLDLSPRMVEKARERGIYDALFVGDAVEFLDGAAAVYDLILAADVLVYLGDLAPVFQAAAKALRRGGALAFTVERFEGDEYQLGPKRRYGHSEAYVQRASAEAGFALTYQRAAPLRTEGGTDVPGVVFVLKKPGADAG